LKTDLSLAISSAATPTFVLRVSVSAWLFQPPGQKDAPVIRPVRLKVEPASWGNALGFQFTGAGLTAFFNPDDLPRGALDLIILTSGRGQRYVLKESDRLQIR